MPQERQGGCGGALHSCLAFGRAGLLLQERGRAGGPDSQPAPVQTPSHCQKFWGCRRVSDIMDTFKFTEPGVTWEHLVVRIGPGLPWEAPSPGGKPQSGAMIRDTGCVGAPMMERRREPEIRGGQGAQAGPGQAQHMHGFGAELQVRLAVEQVSSTGLGPQGPKEAAISQS